MVNSLYHLMPGQYAVIQAIDADESLFHRLNALGFRIGKTIHMIRKGNFNGPLHVRIGSTEIMLRATEANRIQVQV